MLLGVEQFISFAEKVKIISKIASQTNEVNAFLELIFRGVFHF